MKKKISFIFVVTLSFVLFGSQTIFANETIFTEDGNAITEIDITEAHYEVVSEEEVIQDYMTKLNVDRDTAIKELGISNVQLMASCTNQWRHFTSAKKKVESGFLTSGVSLTLHPYAQVKNCGGNETLISVSSAQPGYTFYGLFKNSAHLTTAGAIKTSNIRMQVHASGYIKPTAGGNRYWNYDDCVYVKVKSGSIGCF